MSTAYSAFFSSGLQNSSMAAKRPFGSMSLDIPPMAGYTPDDPLPSSPIRTPLPDDSDVDVEKDRHRSVTPTNFISSANSSQTNLATTSKQPRLRKRRSSLSLQAGNNAATALKSPARAAGNAFNLQRHRSGSVTSTHDVDATPKGAISGRARSGSMGTALRSNKRRSLRAPLPPPTAPLPDVPALPTITGSPNRAEMLPSTAPPTVVTYQFPLRPPLAKRISTPSQAPSPSPPQVGFLKSPTPDNNPMEIDEEMKEN